jgi:chromosome segregation ATPase
MGKGQSKPDNRSEIEKLKDEIREEIKRVEKEKREYDAEVAKLADLQRRLADANNRAGNNSDGVPFQSIINNLNHQLAICNNNLNNLGGQLQQRSADLQNKIAQLSQLQGSYDQLDAAKRKDELEISNLNFAINGPKGYVAQIAELDYRINGPTGYIAEIKANEAQIALLDVSVNVINQEAIFLTQLDYLLQVDGKQQLYGLQNSLDVSLNLLFNYLKKININPDVLYEKINYREKEHEKLHKINNLLNILFYCFYVAFLIIIVCTGNTQREKFLVYLFIVVASVLQL